MGKGKVKMSDTSAKEAEKIFRQIERRRALYIVYYAAALADHAGHVGKVVLQQHDVAHLAGGVTAGGHGYGTVGLLERENVVHAVSGHGHRVAVSLQRADKAALLVGRHAAENGVVLDRLGYFLVCLESARVDVFLRARYAGALGDLGYGHSVVTGYDLDGHSLVGEVFKGLRRLGADLVGEQYQRQRHELRRGALVVK